MVAGGSRGLHRISGAFQEFHVCSRGFQLGLQTYRGVLGFSWAFQGVWRNLSSVPGVFKEVIVGSRSVLGDLSDIAGSSGLFQRVSGMFPRFLRTQRFYWRCREFQSVSGGYKRFQGRSKSLKAVLGSFWRLLVALQGVQKCSRLFRCVPGVFRGVQGVFKEIHGILENFKEFQRCSRNRWDH